MAVLFTAISFAQAKPPTLPETTRDTLYPEIVEYLGFGEYLHYQHPATETRCNALGVLSTLEPYSQYLWEADEEFLPMGGNLTDPSLYVEFHTSGYLKVTVWDSIGNSGTDSIWFNIKDWIEPMPDFTMELDSTNHAVFSGTATSDHCRLSYRQSLDTLNWYLGDAIPLQEGPWTYRDPRVYFTEDSIWNYRIDLMDSCGFFYRQEMTPGMMMSTQPSPGGGWYLTFHTVLQSSKSSDNYVYPIFTIDQDGVRHQLYDDSGEPVILPASSNSLLLKKHPDAYYQGAVAKLSAKKDDGYEVLSYSNQVVNPLPDTDNVTELPSAPKVYPNPAKGVFTVEGKGRLEVTNVLGQVVKATDVDGTATIALPKGFYILKLGNAVQKVVVE